MGGITVERGARSAVVTSVLLTALLVGFTAPAVASAAPEEPRPSAAYEDKVEVAEFLEHYGLFSLARLADGRYGLVESDGRLLKVYSDYSAVTLNGRRIDPVAEPASWTGPGVYLVQMIGPVRTEWRDALAARGTILDFAAPFTFLMWLDTDLLGTLRAFPEVRGVAAYTPDLKLGSTFNGHLQDHETSLTAMIYDPHRQIDPRDLAFIVDGSWDFSYPVQHYTKVKIDRADPSHLMHLLSLPFVVYVDRWTEAEIEGEDSKQIVAGNLYPSKKAMKGYQTWLQSLNIDGTGVIVGQIDTGVHDKHLDFENRVSGPSWGADSNGHGTHTMSTVLGAPIGGDPDGDGFLDGMGMAPKATGLAYALSGSNKQALFEQMSKGGATVSTNSWNIGSNGADYGSDEKEYDGYVIDADASQAGAQPLTIFFSAGNAGASGLTRPHAAKDIISVCNAHSNHTSGGNIDQVASSSSVGPTADKRWKPEFCAPGSDIIAANTGTTGGYTKKSGTSMSCPHAAGAGALVTQWYERTYGTKPQSSMVKAMLVNGAVDMVGGNGAGIPNKFAGWGRLNLINTFGKEIGMAMTHIDDKELTTGQEFTVTASAADTTKPLKITLAWVDPPGTAGCSVCVVNDLDLVVDGSGGTYYGNNFASSWSQAGGAASAIDNLENVFIQSPTGSYTIHVKGTNVAAGPQKFSLVISNAGVASAGISFETPKGGEMLKGGDNVSVGWKSNRIQPNTVTVLFSQDGTTNWQTLASNQAENGTYQWSVPKVDATAARLKATGTDLTGKAVETLSGKFVIDSSPPTATVKAMPATTFVQSFSVEFTATDTGSGVKEVEIFYRIGITGPFASGGKAATSPLNFTATKDGRYEFYASATDKAGHVEAAPAAHEAWTLVDLVPPTLTDSTPKGGATNVDLNPMITLVFSEPMAQGSVAAGLQIAPVATKGTLTWDTNGGKLSFPLLNLQLSTLYTVTVAGKDLAGRDLNSTDVKFTTTAVPPNPAKLSGMVREAVAGAGVSGVKVRALLSGVEFKAVNTDTAGAYVLDKLPAGAFEIRAEKAGFDPASTNQTLAEGDDKKLDFVLSPPGQKAGVLRGKVVDGAGGAVEGAVVTAGKQKATTAADGLFRFDIVAGSFNVKATKVGYLDANQSADVIGGQETEVTLKLDLKPASDLFSMSVGGIPLFLLIVVLLAAIVAAAVAMTLMKKRGGAKCQYCSAKMPRGSYACPVCGAPTAGFPGQGPEQPPMGPGQQGSSGYTGGYGDQTQQYVQPPDR